jgi:hypothetical protein
LSITVKENYQILKDTLPGDFTEPFKRKQNHRLSAEQLSFTDSMWVRPAPEQIDTFDKKKALISETLLSTSSSWKDYYIIKPPVLA